MLLLILGVSAGCSGSVRSQLANYDPPTAAAKAMELYDGDRDGKIVGEEMKKCPELSNSLRRIDASGDGAISRDELQNRFEALETQSDLVAVVVLVTSEGRPLSDATVMLTPAPFMGEGLQTYSGTTSGGGDCIPSGSAVKLPGLPRGFYQVKVTQADQKIDALRGCEISDDASGNRLQISL
jgi:hypothetical protein